MPGADPSHAMYVCYALKAVGQLAGDRSAW